jgi:hypothetical protein
MPRKKVVAIARGADKGPFAKKLGAQIYIDSTAQNAAQELSKLGSGFRRHAEIQPVERATNDRDLSPGESSRCVSTYDERQSPLSRGLDTGCIAISDNIQRVRDQRFPCIMLRCR